MNDFMIEKMVQVIFDSFLSWITQFAYESISLTWISVTERSESRLALSQRKLSKLIEEYM